VINLTQQNHLVALVVLQCQFSVKGAKPSGPGFESLSWAILNWTIWIIMKGLLQYSCIRYQWAPNIVKWQAWLSWIYDSEN